MGFAHSSNDLCRCGHIFFRHDWQDPDDTHCAASCGCKAFVPFGEEPPMTPEEEEEAPQDGSPIELPPPPPQPERRAPYVVGYSVGGHVFEVAMPGDATVRALDGALIVQHHLGPVAGIVHVAPLISKEGAGGAGPEE